MPLSLLPTRNRSRLGSLSIHVQSHLVDDILQKGEVLQRKGEALEEAGQFGRYVACVEAVMETQLRSSLSDEVHPF